MGVYYTLNWYNSQFGTPSGLDLNIMNHLQNITSALSFSTDFIAKCTTSAEATTTTLTTRYKGLEALDNFALAFLMNLTGNVVTLYNVFMSLSAASADCDYGTVAQRMGTLLRSLTNFNADILGVTTLLASANVKYVSQSSGFKLPRIHPVKKVNKSPMRLVAENVYESAFQTL